MSFLIEDKNKKASLRKATENIQMQKKSNKSGFSVVGKKSKRGSCVVCKSFEELKEFWMNRGEIIN